MTTLTRLANLAWIAANSDGHKRYHAALADPETTQREVLLGLVRRNAGTVFGKLHGFPAIHSVEDFQERVPLARWEDVEPWVERIAAGEPGVLTKARVRILELSSGSSAAAKRIPYTADLQRDIRHAVAPWICDAYQRRPWLSRGPGYWSITPPALEDARAQSAKTAEKTPSRIPVGFEEDGEYLGGVWKRLAGATLAVPGAIRLVRDIESFRYVTLLFLLRRNDLTLISVWHPSFLTLLIGALPGFWEGLVRDIERGTLNPPSPLAPAVGTALAKFLSPLPERAAEIRHLGPAAPGFLWPQMGLISCWGDAHAALHLPELQRLFPSAEVQPKGLIATEAFVTIPYAGRHPLAIRSHFFEFLPDGGEGGPPRLAHELETGDVASVVVTTGGGLYRYRLEDRVAVDGFVGPTPSLRFLGKEGHVSDLRGEKLHESFVAGALARTFEGLHISPRFALLAPSDDSDDPQPGYTLYVEISEPAPRCPEIAAVLDAELAANPHYRLCVSLGQLAPARIFRVEKDGVARYLEHRRERGQRLGDVKPLALATETGWSRVFR
jgi:hypothetical protein